MQKLFKVGVVIMAIGILVILFAPLLVDDSVCRDFVAKHGKRYTIVKQLPIPVAHVYHPLDNGVHDGAERNVSWDDFRAFAAEKDVMTVIYQPGGLWYSTRFIYEGERVQVSLQMRAEKAFSSSEARRVTFVFETEIPVQCTASFTNDREFVFDANTNTIKLPVRISSKVRGDAFEIGAVVFFLGFIGVMIGYLSQPSARN